MWETEKENKRGAHNAAFIDFLGGITLFFFEDVGSGPRAVFYPCGIKDVTTGAQKHFVKLSSVKHHLFESDILFLFMFVVCY